MYALSLSHTFLFSLEHDLDTAIPLNYALWASPLLPQQSRCIIINRKIHHPLPLHVSSCHILGSISIYYDSFVTILGTTMTSWTCMKRYKREFYFSMFCLSTSKASVAGQLTSVETSNLLASSSRNRLFLLSKNDFNVARRAHEGVAKKEKAHTYIRSQVS